MPLMLDVFNSDAFHYVELTDSLMVEPFQAGFITSLNLFQERGVPSRDIAIEKKNSVLYVLPFRTPGDMTSSASHRRATLYPVTIPHVPMDTSIFPHQLAMVREFGSSTDVVNLDSVRADHMEMHAMNHGITEEFHKLAAIKGFVYDADGSEHISVYTLFNATKPATQNFNLDTATDSDLRSSVDTLRRNIQISLLGTPMTGNGMVVCGSTFFEKFTGHSAVINAYERWSDTVSALLGGSAQPGDFLRESPVYQAFPYRGFLWKEYQGPENPPDETLDTTLPTFIAPTAAHAFPRDVPGLFVTRWASPDTKFSTVNTVGQARYMFPNLVEEGAIDRLDLHSQQNGLHLCRRPEVLHELVDN